jgi:hypothetical protein
MVALVEILEEDGCQVLHRIFCIRTLNYISVVFPDTKDSQHNKRSSRVLVTFKDPLPQRHFLEGDLNLFKNYPLLFVKHLTLN